MKTAPGTTVIRNGQLIDGTGAAPVADAALVVRDGRIAYAGPAAGAPPPPGARHVDARGGTILPGLVEAHYHPTYFNVAALEDLGPGDAAPRPGRRGPGPAAARGSGPPPPGPRPPPAPPR
jgi:cytosine/adenosine deaminase-related metal-dependent hydrolase